MPVQYMFDSDGVTVLDPNAPAIWAEGEDAWTDTLLPLRQQVKALCDQAQISPPAWTRGDEYTLGITDYFYTSHIEDFHREIDRLRAALSLAPWTWTPIVERYSSTGTEVEPTNFTDARDASLIEEIEAAILDTSNALEAKQPPAWVSVSQDGSTVGT